MTTPPPAGWYADPSDPAQIRFWDGSIWTQDAQAARHASSDPSNKDDARAKRRSEKEEAKRAAAAEKGEAKRAAAAEKGEAKSAKLEARQAEQQAAYELFGGEVLTKPFGGKIVRLYEKGFVRVGGVFSSGSAPVEQLVSIEASSDVAKKSAAGRGAAAIMTGGLSLAGSNKRGDVYLTIVTAATTHVLRESPPTVGNMKSSKALEAAGNSLLSQASSQAPSSSPVVAEPVDSNDGLRDRLRRLKELYDDDLITDQEYESKRNDLLQGL